MSTSFLQDRVDPREPLSGRMPRVLVVDLICNTPFYDRYFLESLQSIGVDLQLALPSYDREPEYFRRHGLRVAHGIVDLSARLHLRNGGLRRGVKAGEWLLNTVLVAAQARMARPDLCHVQWINTIGPFAPELALIRWVRRQHIPIIYTVHDVLPHEAGTRAKSRFEQLYRLVDGMICHTEESRARLIQEFGVGADRIRVIPHGPLFHDSGRVSGERARAELGYGHHQIVVLFSGLVRPYKGLEYLLDAWKLAAAKDPRLLLVLAGRAKDPAYQASIAARIKQHGVSDTVRTDFRYVPEEEMIRHHAAADILVYPYRAITQSGALLAGMGFGKPIVATRVGGFNELLRDGENALLVDYGDVGGLESHLLYLAQHPGERQRLGQAATAYLDQHFAWNAIARRTLTFYQEVLASHVRRSS